MAYDLGDTAVPRLTVAPFDGTTAVTAVVTGPDGSVTTPTPTSGDGGQTWTFVQPLTLPGAWIVVWTVTGKGAGVATDQLVAEPLPPADPAHAQVRLLTNDTDPANRFYSTLEVAAFLAMNGGNPRRAAAQILEAIAANEALVSKKIRTQDLSTDGPAVAAELRALAASLRAQADGDDTVSEDGFEVVEFTPYGSWPERTERPWC